MSLIRIIEKKRDGHILSENEIRQMVALITDPTTPDYQISALLMAIYLKGMNREETMLLTDAMVHSGTTMDLSPIPGVKVDKHSTGGVGDKTSLVLIPLVASMGVPVAKLSGRGLGHTGGTLDKLMAFEGIETTLSPTRFINQVKEIGLAISGQTESLVPADKVMYTLRDLTGTVSSLPLIASSIMSKKIAAGADKVLLDVKVGNGATFRGLDQARELGRLMVNIGTGLGIETVAVLTAMDSPLGYAVGNNLEVQEALLTLQGKGPKPFTELCICLGRHMLQLAGRTEPSAKLEQQLRLQISKGQAFEKFRQMIAYQGGDTRWFDHPESMTTALLQHNLYADTNGYLTHCNAFDIGVASMMTGAGRSKKEDSIDLTAGILLHRQVGDKVSKGDTIATIYSNNQAALSDSAQMLARAFNIGNTLPEHAKLVLEVIRD